MYTFAAFILQEHEARFYDKHCFKVHIVTQSDWRPGWAVENLIVRVQKLEIQSRVAMQPSVNKQHPG